MELKIGHLLLIIAALAIIFELQFYVFVIAPGSQTLQFQTDQIQTLSDRVLNNEARLNQTVSWNDPTFSRWIGYTINRSVYDRWQNITDRLDELKVEIDWLNGKLAESYP